MRERMLPPLEAKYWKQLGRWVQPPLSGVFWSHCHEADCLKKDFPNYDFSPLLFLEGYVLSTVEDEEWKDRFVARLADPTEAMWTQEFIDRIEFQARVCEQEILALLDRHDLSPDDYIRELFRTHNEIAGAWFFPITLAWNLEHYAIEQGVARDEEELSRWADRYKRVTWLEQQSRDIEDIASLIRERTPDMSTEAVNAEWLETDETIRTRVGDHIRTFEWFGTHHWSGEPYTLDKCLSDIRDVLRRGPREERSEAVDDSSSGNEMIGKVLALFAYWRTHCAEVAAKTVYFSREKLIACAERLGMTYEELTYLSSREIIEALDASPSTFVLPKNYSERRSGYGCIVDGQTERIVTGSELTDLTSRVVVGPVQDIELFKGTVACKGAIVQGLARVIISPDDFGRFESGNVLVAPETTPDYVPLMKKASAIVTDIGGITSHAAIVARELKKPCIIGTKIATQVLHDGDLVEVDVDHGVVRILERAEKVK